MASTPAPASAPLPPGGAVSAWGDSAPQQPRPDDTSGLLDERALSKLKWRCRRGLLENDLFVERFFRQHEASLTVRQAQGLTDLMDLSDNDLMDLLLQRKEPGDLEAASAGTPEALEVLAMMRVAPLAR